MIWWVESGFPRPSIPPTLSASPSVTRQMSCGCRLRYAAVDGSSFGIGSGLIPPKFGCAPRSASSPCRSCPKASRRSNPRPRRRADRVRTAVLTVHQFEINQPLDRLVMRRAEVFMTTRFFWMAPAKAMDSIADLSSKASTAWHMAARRTRQSGLQFETVECRRIVAGGDHHSADGLERLDRERDRRRRSRSRSVTTSKTVSGENLGGPAAKLIGKKPCDRSRQRPSSLYRARGWSSSKLRRPEPRAKVGEVKCLGDDRPPSVCAEFNLSHNRRSERFWRRAMPLQVRDLPHFLNAALKLSLFQTGRCPLTEGVGPGTCAVSAV